MSTSRLLATVNKYKAQLLAHEKAAEQALNVAHAHTLATINAILDILYRQMQQKIQNGEVIPVEWLYENNRLKATKAMIENNINHFGAMAQMQAGQLQHTGVQLGQQSGMEQLQATVPAGVKYSFGVPSPKAIASLVGVTQAGSPLADLFNGFGAEVADKAGKALITGVTLGWNPREVASSVQDALDVSRARALTIARDQLNNAYRMAAVETYRANDDVVESMVRIADLSPRTCAACIALNGTIYKLDDDPGFHPNDRCSLAPKTKSWSEILGPLGIDTSDISDTTISIQSGSDWFDNQDEAAQRQILGNAGYEVWKNNDDISLSDFVGKSSDPDWGNSIYQRSVKQVLARR